MGKRLGPARESWIRSSDPDKSKPTLEERVSKTKAEIKHMRKELEEVERLHGRFMDSIINPPIITKPTDDLDMMPGSVHSVGEPEPEPVGWWRRIARCFTKPTFSPLELFIYAVVLTLVAEWSR